MNGSQKAAGVGALLQGVFFVIVLVLILGVLPGFGLQGPNDFADPAKVLPFVASQPFVAFWLFPGDILFAVFLIITVVGLHDHLQGHSRPSLCGWQQGLVLWQPPLFLPMALSVRACSNWLGTIPKIVTLPRQPS